MPIHPIPPVWSRNPETPPRVLILGSFPSVKSRETGFFYGHPQNRFWRVMAAVLDAPVPKTIPEKIAMLETHGVALWDVVAACTIVGSADSSIRDMTPTDLSPILAGGMVRAVFTNGSTATRLYTKYHAPIIGISAIPLPSTSPANAAWSAERLTAAWRVILEALK